MPDLRVEVQYDDSQVSQGLADLERRLAQFRADDIQIGLGVDTTEINRELNAVRQSIEERLDEVQVELEFDRQEALREADRISDQIERRFDDIEIGASLDTGQIEADMDDAEDTIVGGFERIRGAVIPILAGIAAGFSVDSIIGQLNEVSDSIRELDRSAREFGLDTTQFQMLTVAARETNAEVDTLGSFLRDFRERFGEATALGTGELQEAFEALGLIPAQFANANDALAAFVDRLRTQTPEVQRALQAMASGPGADLAIDQISGLVDTLQGIVELDALEFISPSQVQAMVRFRGELDQVQSIFQAGFTTEFTSDLDDAETSMENIDRLSRSIGEALGNAAAGLVTAADRSVGVFRTAGLVLEEFFGGELSIAEQIELTNARLQAQEDRIASFTSQYDESNSRVREATMLAAEYREEIARLTETQEANQRIAGSIGAAAPTLVTGGLGGGLGQTPDGPDTGPVAMAVSELQVAGDALVEAYQRQLLAAQDLSIEERLLESVRLGLTEGTAEQIEQARVLAAEIDRNRAVRQAEIESERALAEAARETESALRATERVERERIRALEDQARATQNLIAQGEGLVDRLFPLDALQERREEEGRLLQELASRGRIDSDQLREGQLRLDQQLQAQLQGAEEPIREQANRLTESFVNELATATSERDLFEGVVRILAENLGNAIAQSGIFDRILGGLFGNAEETATTLADASRRFIV